MPDELDRLLNEGLSEYAAAPDRPGLEARVLAGVNRHIGRRGHAPMYAAAAAAVLVGLLIARPWITTQRNLPVPPKIIEVARNHTALRPVSPPSAIRVKPVALRRRTRNRRVEPKRPEFPTNLPLTPQERALVYIAQSEPAQLAVLTRPMTPLEVPLIEIEPLDKGKN